MPTPSPLANAIRALSMDAVEKAASGHCGLPLGFADVATLLFQEFIRFDASAPEWPDRDRLVLSAGHGSMLLYSLLYLTGYPGMTIEEIKNFRQLGSKTPGHPEFGHTVGVETTTGPLGQGLANAVGMAIAERHLNARFGDDLVNHKTYVIAGDGCLMEGISQEALTLAGHLRLKNLIVLFDDNAVTIDGSTNLADSTEQIKRFKASGWSVARVDGHNMDAVRGALMAAQNTDRPTLIACRTIIGYGAKIAGTGPAHGGPYGAEEIATIRKALDWTYEPFVVPDAILKEWRTIGTRNTKHRAAWQDRLKASPKKAEFEAAVSGKLPSGITEAIGAHKKKLAEAPKADGTRKWSGAALEVLTALVPEMVGGSADLTGSNNTRTAAAKAPLTPENYGGRYLHWGVREHAMAAAMNGMALHGGVIPYSGTFLVFSDYSRPAIRLGALMGQRVIHVMTHDSIGVGEDGPTHQPVEHVASLRMIPNLAGLPSGRWDRDGGGVGDRRAADGGAVAAGADTAECRSGAEDACGGESRGEGRLCALAGEQAREGRAGRHGIGDRDRARCSSEAGSGRHRRARRFPALLLAVRRAAREVPDGNARRETAQGRHRSRRARRLGPLDRA